MYFVLALGFSAFVFSLLLTPFIRDLFRRLGLVDRPDGVRKLHREPIPRVGGISIVLSYLAAFGLCLSLPFSYRSQVQVMFPEALLLVLAAGVVFLTGLLDDLLGLRPWQKLAGQLLAAAIAYVGGVQIHLSSGSWLDPWLSIPISIAWIIGCTNAFNLIDGLDGLAAGVGLFATVTVLIAALTQGHLPLILVTMPLAGCLIGFLRYNFNPASVFLGDCGSLLIGFLLGCFGGLWSQKSATILGMTAPLMALSIPLLDTGLAIIRRFLRGQPIFGADRGHIHHRLLDRGLTPRQVAFILYGICGLAAALSLLQSLVHNQFGGLVIVLFCLAAWIGVQHLGYIEFQTASHVLLTGRVIRRLIDTQTRLKQIQTDLQASRTLEDRWQALLAAAEQFAFQEVRMKVDNQAFFARLRPASSELSWQLRIPLPDHQYVNFTREVENPLGPLVLEAFVKLVQEEMQKPLAEVPLVAISVEPFTSKAKVTSHSS